MAVEKNVDLSVIRTSVLRVKEFKYSKNQNFPSISGQGMRTIHKKLIGQRPTGAIGKRTQMR